MKLFFFQCGSIKIRKRLLVEDAPSDQWLVVPVPFFLIRHPGGNVLFDTGMPFSAGNAAETRDCVPIMTAADHVSNQLAKVGLKTNDITHIVLSHLHEDHAGGLEAFENAECFVQTAELAGDGEDFADRYPQLRWRRLSGAHDLFDDGRVRIEPTPGHTPGHQSLALALKRENVLLAADSVYLEELLDRDVLPGQFSDRAATGATLGLVRELCRNGVRIIAGHDPIAWSKFKLAPNCYE